MGLKRWVRKKVVGDGSQFRVTDGPLADLAEEEEGAL